MYTAKLLLSLKQGKRSLEDFIQEYLDVANSDFPDDVLIDFFGDSINQPLKSKLICEGPCSSLSQFLDYALLCVGSSFTVGVAEEERDTSTQLCDRSHARAHLQNIGDSRARSQNGGHNNNTLSCNCCQSRVKPSHS